MADGRRARQIVAMGGGGFSMEPDNLALDRYVLQVADRPRPRICFLGTASGDSAVYAERFYAAFRTLPCEPADLSLFEPATGDFRSFLLARDVIYVGGGNTRNLLLLWREWGIDEILREAWQRGIVLAGISAGAICWFEQGVSDAVIPGRLAPLACLGFLPGSCCPHYDGEVERRPTYRRLVETGAISGGLAADDGAALHFVDRELHRVVVSRPEARAYRVELVSGSVRETLVGSELLLADRE